MVRLNQNFYQIAFNILCATIALMGLLAYLPGLSLLGSLSDAFIPMAPSTAVSFIFLAIIIALLRTKSFYVKNLIIILITSVVTMFGLLEIPGFFYTVDLNFENLIVPNLGTLNNIPIARMSPSTGLLFFIAGLTILSYHFSRGINKKLLKASGIINFILLMGSLIFLLGYLYGTPLLYKNNLIPMALTTAMAFLFLSLSFLLYLGNSVFPLAIFTENSTRSKLIRYFMPLIIGSMLVTDLMSKLLPLNHAIIFALVAALTIFIAALLIFSISRLIGDKIDTSEKARIKIQNELEEHKLNLENEVKKRTEELEKLNAELTEKYNELERFNKLFIGREFRIKELKDEIERIKKTNS